VPSLRCVNVPLYIDIVPNRNSPPALLLREGWRENGKVRKRTLANLSSWSGEKVETLRRLLKNEPLVGRDDAFDIIRSLPHGHVGAVLGTLRKLGLEKLIDPKPSPRRDQVLAEARIREEVRPAGLDWISALHSSAIRALSTSAR